VILPGNGETETTTEAPTAEPTATETTIEETTKTEITTAETTPDNETTTAADTTTAEGTPTEETTTTEAWLSGITVSHWISRRTPDRSDSSESCAIAVSERCSRVHQGWHPLLWAQSEKFDNSCPVCDYSDAETAKQPINEVKEILKDVFEDVV
jgi:hypothetical protein